MPTLASKVKRSDKRNVMQRPNPDSIYYDEFMQIQKKLRARIVELRKNRDMVQEDMADYELSVRQYQRMEQDPTAIVSLWQVFKIAKAHNLDIHELLDL
jgi:predicted sulfurtransferase